MNKLIKAALLMSWPLLALEQQPYAKSWSLHGFAAQGIIQSKDSNFVNQDGDISTDLTEVGINASYQLSPNIRFAGQLNYLNGGNRYEEGVRIDYLLLDWTVKSDLESQLNLYVGRYKNQHWLYSSTRDVPHTRPSIILPQSVYYDIFRDVALGSDGIALSYSLSKEFGEIDVHWSYGRSPISENAGKLLVSDLANGEVSQDFTHQANLFYRPENTNFQFGVSLLDSDFDYKAKQFEPFFDAEATSQRIMLNFLYSGLSWELAGEFLQERFYTKGFLAPNLIRDTKGQGGYIQARYFINADLTLLARYDRFDVDKNDRKGNELSASTGGVVPAYFGYVYDSTIGFSYKFNKNWQLQAEYHWLEGRARLSPAIIPNLIANNGKNWNMWAMQLMYWF